MNRVYEMFTGMNLQIAEKIQRRRYQLLVHSCIYYELNRNIISDDTWNSWSQELVLLQQQYPDISEQVTLHKYFKDWDGSTGAFLPITLDWVKEIANRLVTGKIVSKPVVKKKGRLF